MRTICKTASAVRHETLQVLLEGLDDCIAEHQFREIGVQMVDFNMPIASSQARRSLSRDGAATEHRGVTLSESQHSPSTIRTGALYKLSSFERQHAMHHRYSQSARLCRRLHHTQARLEIWRRCWSSSIPTPDTSRALAMHLVRDDDAEIQSLAATVRQPTLYYIAYLTCMTTRQVSVPNCVS